MKAVILAGGFGTRISEESQLKPKPLIEIGGKPILWHIMKLYSYHGINEFIICCGYKGNMIKEYFSNYFLYNSDVTFDLRNNGMKIHSNRSEPWSITLVDTGEQTLTGGRLRRVRKYIEGDDPFCFTYGDGLADVDISKLIQFHRSHGKMATLTATFAPGRFGALNIQDGAIKQFKEKPRGDGGMINGGFFVLSPAVLNFIEGDRTTWEEEPLEKLASQNELMAFPHSGFWQPMDTLRDKNVLERLWESGQAPWKIWV